MITSANHTFAGEEMGSKRLEWAKLHSIRTIPRSSSFPRVYPHEPARTETCSHALPPQLGTLPSCSPGSWAGHGWANRGQVHTSLQAGDGWDQGSPLAPTLRFKTDSSRKPSRLLQKGLVVLANTHTQL